MSFLRSKAGIQAILVILFGLVLLAMFLAHDVSEQVMTYLAAHEQQQFDEIYLSLTIVGLLGLVYAVLRAWDLHGEIVRRDKAEQRVGWIAEHDSLTELPNRRALKERIAASSDGKDAEHLGVFAIDLDGFKKVNDLVGHHAGDMVLVEATRRLKGILSP